MTSACSKSSGGTNGAGLAVFDKGNLYAGGSLTLGANWFEFVDRYSGGPYAGAGGAPNSRDLPVLTYTSTINNRLYLTASTVTASGGKAIVVYSHIEGATDAPVFYSATETVTTSFQITGAQGELIPAVDAPGCQKCMQSYVNGWIQSAGVWAFVDGTQHIVSTMVWGDPRYLRSTQIISTENNTQTGAAKSLQLAGGENGSGSMASEIAVPLSLPGVNEALIVYDHSRSDFYPGVKSALWNISSNSITYVNILDQGSFTPTSGDQSRWVDFISAITPLSGSSQMVLGATVAAFSSIDPQRTTYWANVSP